MRHSTKIALAFIAFAGVTGPAVAQERDRDDDRRGSRFERLDADTSGDVTFEEFAARLDNRIGDADANSDGTLTVEEIADRIQRMRAERQARRLIERFDSNNDGQLTLAEIESRQRKRFALLDRNDDGKIAEDEMPRRGNRGNRDRR